MGGQKIIYFLYYVCTIFSLYEVSDFTEYFNFGWKIFLLIFFSLCNPVAQLFTSLYLGHYNAIKKSKEIFLFSNDAWVIPFIQNPDSLKNIRNTILRFSFLTFISYLYQIFMTGFRGSIEVMLQILAICIF